MVTVERVKQAFDYNPETGQLTWKIRTSNRVKIGYTAASLRKDSRGYTSYYDIRIDKKAIPAHRVAWAITHGKWPDHDIDHIDGNGLNNKLDNLRDIPRSINQYNTGLWRHNTSGIKGVFLREYGRWAAKVQYKGKGISLGMYDTKEEAAAARAAWNPASLGS
jgi:hypothetical protein